jgi:hypothetical protein
MRSSTLVSASILLLAISLAGKTQAEFQGPVEIHGRLFDGGSGVPECCVTSFYLILCSGEWYHAWLESDALDLEKLVGHDVRLIGIPFQCGMYYNCRNFNATHAVLEPCQANPVSPSSWGMLKSLYN